MKIRLPCDLLYVVALWTVLVTGHSVLTVQSAVPQVTLYPDAVQSHQVRYQPKCHGIAFFQGRIFAASNIGLIEIREGFPALLIQWDRRDGVVGDIWVDKAHDRLWVWLEASREFGVYDGKSWKVVPLPIGTRKITRGDQLIGARLSSNSHDLYLSFASGLWVWEGKERGWKSKQIPKGGFPESRFTELLACNDQL